MGKKHLSDARKVKNDEFYTPYDVVKETVEKYKDKFKGQVVYCPCDSEKSNFYKFFKDKFEEYGLKQLIATSYNGVKLTYDNSGERSEALQGDGDFRSAECVQLRDECDVVCTNPPFSLFREFIDWVVECEFLVIGPKTAILYKTIWQKYMKDVVKIGSESKSMKFEGNDKPALCNWYTSFDGYKGRQLKLDKVYKADEYPVYDNYEAIEVGRIKNIPKDYDGEMGVPITIVEYDLSDYEVVGLFNNVDGEGYVDAKRIDTKQLKNRKEPVINGISKYVRIVIKKK